MFRHVYSFMLKLVPLIFSSEIDGYVRSIFSSLVSELFWLSNVS